MQLKKYATSPDFLIKLTMILVLVLIYHGINGIETLVPTNINWLLSARHDWGQHYLGWAFYRDEPWSFPLGEMQAVRYPIGSNAGFWDVIPCVAILLKPFSSVLPDDFQYFGLWLQMCMILTAYYTLKICKLYNVKPIHALFCAILVACNPVLVYRFMHPALCAHFLLLASIYQYLKPTNAGNVGKINRNQIAIIVISAAVTPYLSFMISGFNIILPLKNKLYDRLLSWKQVATYIAASFAGVLLVFIVIGLITFGGGEKLRIGGAYKMYGMNLNALINPGGWSKFLPQLPWVTPHQYEGYLYLGIGLSLLVIISIGIYLFSKKYKGFAGHHKFLIPLLVFLIACALFAISNRVTFNDTILFTYPMPGIIKQLGDIFRACGRVMWVPMYAAVLFFIIVFARSTLPGWVKTTVLALIVAIQVYDMQIAYFRQHAPSGTYKPPLDEQNWSELVAPFGKMITYPPFNNHLLNTMDYQDLLFVALKNHKVISTGYTARDTPERNEKITDSLTTSLMDKVIASDEVYITTPQYLDVFKPLIASHKVNLVYMDGYYALYDAAIKTDVKQDGIAEQEKQEALRKVFGNKKDKVVPLIGLKQCDLKFAFDEGYAGGDYVYVSGWGYKEGVNDNKGDSVFVAVQKGDKLYFANTQQTKRPDLTTVFNKTYLEDSGFKAFVSMQGVMATDQIWIVVKQRSGEYCYRPATQIQQFLANQKPQELKVLPAANGQVGSADEVNQENGQINISGWTAFEKEQNANNLIKVVFIGQEKNFAVGSLGSLRDDVTRYLKDGGNYDKAGFNITIDSNTLPEGTYKIGLLLKSRDPEKQSMMVSDKTITVKH